MTPLLDLIETILLDVFIIVAALPMYAWLRRRAPARPSPRLGGPTSASPR